MAELPEFSVSQVCDIIKSLLENTFGTIKITGEIKDFKLNSSSGHAYFTVTDGDAILKCVSWSGVNKSFIDVIADGKLLTLTGKISSYAKSSTYQMTVHNAENAGAGAIALMLEVLKKKLIADGIFDESRKKPLPLYPERIGIISSRTGAVIRDIMHVLTRRYPCKAILYHASMQGESSPKECIEAIRYFNKTKDVDVIIIARGGGSTDDLMPFNNEALVRMIASSKIPIISAIGHETDFSFCDFAADVRAPTPSAAAEIVAPSKENVIVHLNSINNMMAKTLKFHISERYEILGSAANFIQSAVVAKINDSRITILEASQKIKMGMAMFVSGAVSKLELYNTNIRGYTKILEKKKHNLAIASKVLELSNPENILKKGYAIVRNDDGKVASSIENTSQKMVIQMRDGKLSVVKEFLI